MAVWGWTTRSCLSISRKKMKVYGLEFESKTYYLLFLPGESQGRGSLLGCCLWGHTESDTTEAT